MKLKLGRLMLAVYLKKYKNCVSQIRFWNVFPIYIFETIILLLFLIALKSIIYAAENICVMCAGPANLTLSIDLSFSLCSNLPIKKYIIICP